MAFRGISALRIEVLRLSRRARLTEAKKRVAARPVTEVKTKTMRRSTGPGAYMTHLEMESTRAEPINP